MPTDTNPTSSVLAQVDRVADRAASVADRAAELAVLYGGRIVGAAVFLTIAWFLSAWLAGVMRRALSRPHVDVTLAKFASSATRWAVLLLSLVACLGVFGIETTSFAAILGAAGLAIGLAFQGSLSNLAAGVMLLIFRPFKVGDRITVLSAGVSGLVDEIGLFFTAIDTPDNRRFIVPNSAVFGSTIENTTYHAHRRVEFTFSVAGSADIERTRQTLLRAMERLPARLPSPAPEVALRAIGPSGVDWDVFVWSRNEDYGAVRQAALQSVKEGLESAGIEMPLPRMDVRVRAPVQLAPTPQGTTFDRTERP